jgi:signal transduction histidine kinase/ActR/RegA family two-component response regulator
LLSVTSDCLFLAAYGLAVLAIETRPDAPPPPGEQTRASAYEWIGGGILGAGLMAYFVIIPSRVAPDAYETYVSSMTLFVLLDLAILARLVWLASVAAERRWRATYGTLAAAFLVTLLSDAAELLAYRAGGDLEMSGIWGIAWVAQFPFFTAAAVVACHVSGPRAAQEARPAVADPSVSPLVPFTFALPAVHLGGRLAGWLDPRFDGYRGTVVLSCMLALGLLAIAAHRRAERRHRRVRRELQRVQAELQRARKMEALGRLAGGVAHDFNNLLSVVIGYSELLLERAAPGDRQLESLQQIQDAAERAVAITRQLMTFSQRGLIEGGTFEVDRAVLAREDLLTRLVGPAIDLRLRPTAEGGWTMGDIQQFERVLINLVANAREAMPDGGTVEIGTRWVDVEEEGEASLPAGRYLEVSVSDTGCGMSDEVLAHLFEPFYTTKPRGQNRGLGLAVVYGIVRQAGGHVEVSSTVGKGTTVRAWFPAAEAPTLAQPAAAISEPGPESDPATILLAEDERGLRRLMRSCLERAGFRVLDAPDGRAAFDLAAQHDGRIDLLLTDVIMPGMNGRELAERLEPERPEMRVLFVSGYSADMLRDLQLPNAGVSFLQKPFTPENLVRRVQQLLDARELPSTLADVLGH